jgi:superfamily I DNA/RNA helicase
MKQQPRLPLNADQKKAVASVASPLVLQAGAGSGKTFVLIEKQLYVLEQNPALDLTGMVTITFTNKATDELRGRLQNALYQQWLRHRDPKMRRQIALCNMAPVSTIHEFCITLLRQYGHAIDFPNTFTIRSCKQEMRDIAIRHIGTAMGEPVLEGIPQYTLLRMAEALLDEAANHGVALDENDLAELDFAAPNNDFYNAFKPLLLRILRPHSGGSRRAEAPRKRAGNQRPDCPHGEAAGRFPCAWLHRTALPPHFHG